MRKVSEEQGGYNLLCLKGIGSGLCFELALRVCLSA